MSFLYPQFLFAFAVLVIPILLHLFHLRKFKVFYFSNVSFLKELDTTSKSARKIKNYLILLLRLLAFSSLVFAFAQPYFPTENLALDDDKQEVRILFIDNSHSLSAKGVEGELFAQAKLMARELVANDRPGGKYLIFSNFLSAQEMRLMSQPDAIDFIDKLTQSSSSRKIGEIISTISSVINDEQVTGKILIISDLQVNQWTLTKEIEASLPLTFIKLTPSNGDNMSLDSMWISSPVLRPGAKFDLNIKIVNHSLSEINSASVNVLINNREQQFTAEFNGTNEAVLTLNYTAPDEGFHPVIAEIDDQQVFFDDVLNGVIEVRPSLQVGVINGTTGRSYPSLVYSLDDYFVLTQWSSSQLQLQEASNVDLLVLNELKQIDPALRDLVTSMIDNGKTVVLVPNRQFDQPSWNALLTDLEMPLLQYIDSSASFISTIHSNHGFFEGVFDSKAPQIQLPVTRNAKLSAIGSRSVPLLSYSDNSAFLAVSSKRSNACYLFNSDLNRSNPNIVSSDLYSTLLLRIAETVGAQSSLYHVVGEDGMYYFASNNSSETPIKLVHEDTEFIPVQRRQNTLTQLVFSGTYDESLLNPGIYTVSQNNSLVGKLAINVNRHESDLTHWDSDAFTSHLSEFGLERVEIYELNEATQILSIDPTDKTSFWRILLILAIVLFVAEMLVIKIWK